MNIKFLKNIELGFDKVLTTYLMNYLQYKVGRKNKVANRWMKLPKVRLAAGDYPLIVKQ